ncbi:hypothetical protein GGR50DRAFT_675413, partial [Xylaria sp. CBS 124048]
IDRLSGVGFTSIAFLLPDIVQGCTGNQSTWLQFDFPRCCWADLLPNGYDIIILVTMVGRRHHADNVLLPAEVRTVCSGHFELLLPVTRP